ncbi:hypothetical protein GCM10011415_39960 [Salipiger pallidus]|uniref:Uncharacterized protein n=1 Tax=Salipiger pallidus TaxID=1775170 RepID=A0A8J2ZNN8_9RHOB|nr:hypothetical protein GCM10011415_39960 [Salipiger pallidus]
MAAEGVEMFMKKMPLSERAGHLVFIGDGPCPGPERNGPVAARSGRLDVYREEFRGACQ